MKRRLSRETEQALLVRYLQYGEAEAYDELVTYFYREIQQNIYYTLKRCNTTLRGEYLREEAADISHDFFMDKFEELLRKYDHSRGSLRTWLLRCSANYTVDRLRKSPPDKQGEALNVDEEEWKTYYVLKELAVEAIHNPHHEREEAELLSIIMKYVEELPEHYRRTVKLRLEGLSDEEVARRLAIPVGTVKSHYSRAKQIIRDRLRGDGYLGP